MELESQIGIHWLATSSGISMRAKDLTARVLGFNADSKAQHCLRASLYPSVERFIAFSSGFWCGACT